MKTRIVYPELWLDKDFASCMSTTKLLFCYLINNIQLKLSPYLHITDRQIMFDIGLTVNQLETGKKELTNLRWCFFAGDWVFHNHKCAYVDYEGRDRVQEAKEKEISSVPLEIKEVFKGLITGCQPVLNHKSKIINPKSETIKQKTEDKFNRLDSITAEVVSEIALQYSVKVFEVEKEKESMKLYCQSSGKSYKNYKAALQNWVRRKIDDKKIIPTGAAKTSLLQLLEQKELQYGNHRCA